MKRLSSVLALALGLVAALPAYAAGTPNTINAAFGSYDFDKDGGREAVDFRLEYQWGASLLPMLNPDWASLDQWAQMHPIVGFETTGDGMTYFHGGFGVDAPIGSHFIVSWDEAFGLYGHGDSAQSLDSPFQIRSQFELGYRFNNDMRLSGYISHMSNFGASSSNPGAETAGAYLRVPVSWLAH